MTPRRLSSRTAARGFIALVRSPETLELLRDAPAFALFSLICFRARHSDTGHGGLGLGQMVLGRASAGTELQLTEGQIRAALDRLKSAGLVAISSTKRGSVVTVINSDIYDIAATDSDQQNTGAATKKQPTAGRVRDQPRATKEERRKEDTLPRPASPVAARGELFCCLAAVEGSQPDQLTDAAARTIAVALAQIRRVMPSVTAQEIRVRAAEYRRVMPSGTRLTAMALAKHWAKCSGKPVVTVVDTTEAAKAEPEGWRRALDVICPGNTFEGAWVGLPAIRQQEVKSYLARGGAAA